MPKTEILKPVPSVENLEINHDGTIVYFEGKLKNICSRKYYNKITYKYISIRRQRYSISKLVYETFIGELPKVRKMIYLDGNSLNTHFKNLGPRAVDSLILTKLKKVPGYDDLHINEDGKIIVQYGFEILQGFHSGPDKIKYPVAYIYTDKGCKLIHISLLVAKAHLGWRKKGKIIHIDNDLNNNHYKNLKAYSNKQYGSLRAPIMLKKRKPNPDRKTTVPKEDTELVKQKLLNGATLRSIAEIYDCTDMAIVRFKKKHLTERQIKAINKAKNINTKHTPKRVVKQVVNALKRGDRQIDLVKKYKLSPSVVCRINRKYIRDLKNKTNEGN